MLAVAPHFILVGSSLEHPGRDTAWIWHSLLNVRHGKTSLHLYYLAGLSACILGKGLITLPSFKAGDTMALGRQFGGARDTQIT